MKEIISNSEKVLDAMYPNKKNKILFKNVEASYNINTQSEIFSFYSYKVEYGEGEFSDVEKLTKLRRHVRRVEKDTLDALRSLITVNSTGYTNIKSEEILKGVIATVGVEKLFGLDSSELIIR